MPGWLACILAFAAGLGGMEAVAWATHRFVMHGPLWNLHRSHHEPRAGRFERNDLFAVIFAMPAILLFAIASATGSQPLFWFAAGITAYGVLYVLVHDGLVHRRIWMPFKARSGYLQRLVRAHHLHHRTRTKHGAVSFGFLLAPSPRDLAARLKTNSRKTRALS